jgi:hypothetical protein
MLMIVTLSEHKRLRLARKVFMENADDSVMISVYTKT